jgi:hypothetical protein
MSKSQAVNDHPKKFNYQDLSQKIDKLKKKSMKGKHLKIIENKLQI